MEGAKRQLVSSFLAMESPGSILRLAKEIGDGSISNVVQEFFNEFCLNHSVGDCQFYPGHENCYFGRTYHVDYQFFFVSGVFDSQIVRKFPPSRWYMSSVLKLLILAAESEGQEVLDDLYNQHITLLHSSESYGLHALESFQDFTQRSHKSYLYSITDGAIGRLASCVGKDGASKFKDLVLTIQVSSNMLEGSTGYCFMLCLACWNFPFRICTCKSYHFFKTVVPRGAGLSSICLGLLNASKVIATDGNPSTLANLKHNFTINASLLVNQNNVEFHELLWESASEDAVTGFGADIILGADLIYDISCIPYLVRLLTLFLSSPIKLESNCEAGGEGTTQQQDKQIKQQHEMAFQMDVIHPIAYMATVIRNVNTMDVFISSAHQAGLLVEDVTKAMRPPVFLPQLTDIDRSAICLHRLSLDRHDGGINPAN